MKFLSAVLIAIGLLFHAGDGFAQQSETFGNYVVHYNVINSDQIPPQVAQGYGIKRSSSRALVNIAVMDSSQGPSGTAVRAAVTTSTINLTGQRREVEMREIVEEGEAIYYIGELPIHNMETYNFTVHVQVDGQPEPFEVKFRQQLFTE